MPDFSGRAAHPEINSGGTVGASLVQPAVQLRHRRRQNEYPHEVGAEGIFELLSALPVDVEQRIESVSQRFLNRFLGTAVAVVENISPFRELIGRDEPLELCVIDKMIINIGH